MQALSGTLPDVGSAVASKLRAFSVGNTGLEQCRPSHLAALGSRNYTGQVRPDCFGIILAVQGGCVGCLGIVLAVQGHFGCSATVLAVRGLTWLFRECLVLACQGLFCCSGTIRLSRDYFGCWGIDVTALGVLWLVRGYLGCLGIVLAVQGLSWLFGD